MATTTTIQEATLPKYQEDFLKDMLASTKFLTTKGMDVPEYRDYIAGLAPEELEAFEKAKEGIGAYQPFLDKASDLTDAGAGMTMMGADVLKGTEAQYDPSSYKEFMDPYMEDVIAATDKQIQKQKEMDAQALAAKAGTAFGGQEPLSKTQCYGLSMVTMPLVLEPRCDQQGLILPRHRHKQLLRTLKGEDRTLLRYSISLDKGSHL